MAALTMITIGVTLCRWAPPPLRYPPSPTLRQQRALIDASAILPFKKMESFRAVNDAAIAPACTIGPSRPTGSPIATLQDMPNTLAMSVRSRRMPTSLLPFR